MPPQLAPPCVRSSLLQKLPSYTRAFSVSSSALSSNHVPPESPSYIRLPSNPDSDSAKPTRVRGHLPVPRQIFSRQDGDRKAQAAYIEQTVPKRTKALDSNNATQKWKAEMADARRTNLEGGLQALWKRHSRKESLREARLRRNMEEQARAAAAPERDDDRFTRGTVLESVLDTKVHADPNRFSRVDRSRNKILTLERAKREARRDALIKLYMGASSFIVHESELQAEIDHVFADDYFTKQANVVTENAWGLHGKPLSVAQMLTPTHTPTHGLSDIDDADHQRTAMMQKRIAEEFTGGKME